jgi:16S rRNA (cytosine967-C5)-methyltransferase
MKLYPSIKKELVFSLSYLFYNQASATQVVRYTFKKNKKWGAKDRRTYSEIFFDIVRYWGGFSEVLEKDLIHSTDLEDEDIEDMIDFYLEEDSLERLKKTKLDDIAHKELLEEVKNSFDSQQLTNKYLSRLLTKPSVFLRANLSKTSVPTLIDQLLAEGIEAEAVSDNKGAEGCIKLTERKNVLQTEPYKNGLFEIQDGASQDVAPFLEVKGSSRVADTCAGAGGKSLHLSDLMEGKGRILALDVSERRLEELKKRSKRSGFQNIETRVIKNNKTLKRLSESFDRVLIDAPCSGTGTFRRKPAGKMHFRKAKLQEYLATQKDILDLHSKLVKLEGLMVYATCSVLKAENEDQISNFLKRNQNFELVESQTNFMGDREFDGFFMSKLKRVQKD